MFASLVLVFSDLALGAALIQRKELSRSTATRPSGSRSGAACVFAILGFALAGPLAALYGEPDAKPLLQVLSLGFVVNALGAPQQSLMLRDMDFRRVEMLPMIGALAGAVAGVAVAAPAAAPGRSSSSTRSAAAVTTIAVWLRSPWRPRFAFSRESLRDLGGFSVFMLGHRLLYYLQTNGDRFLIGRFLGTAALGAYAIAFNTIIQPASQIGGPLQRLMSPAFCRIQDEPERIAAAWARVVRLLAGRLGAAAGRSGGRGPGLRPGGARRPVDAAVPVIQILAWVGIVQALQSLSVDVLMARDRARTIFRFSLVLVTCHLVAFAWAFTGAWWAWPSRSPSRPRSWSPGRRSSRRARSASRRWCSCRRRGVFQAAAGMCLVMLAGRGARRTPDRPGLAARRSAAAWRGGVRGTVRVARAGAGPGGPRRAPSSRRRSQRMAVPPPPSSPERQHSALATAVRATPAGSLAWPG